MEIKNHFMSMESVFKEGKLHSLKKKRGPYQHRFDLPGGSQKQGKG